MSFQHVGHIVDMRVKIYELKERQRFQNPAQARSQAKFAKQKKSGRHWPR